MGPLHLSRLGGQGKLQMSLREGLKTFYQQVEALVLPRLAPVPFLLGLGLEGSVRCLKVWRLDTKDKAGGAGPELIRVSR